MCIGVCVFPDHVVAMCYDKNIVYHQCLTVMNVTCGRPRKISEVIRVYKMCKSCQT